MGKYYAHSKEGNPDKSTWQLVEDYLHPNRGREIGCIKALIVVEQMKE